MEAEPEMFGAAIAAPEGSAHGGASALAATRLERRTWTSLSSEAKSAAQEHAPANDAPAPGDARSASAAGRAALGAIALVQVIWWALLVFVALQLFAL